MDRVTICVYVKNESDEIEEKTLAMIDEEASRIFFIASNLRRVAMTQSKEVPVFALWLWLIPNRSIVAHEKAPTRKTRATPGDEEGIESRSRSKNMRGKQLEARVRARQQLFDNICHRFSERFATSSEDVRIEIVNFAEHVLDTEVEYLLNVATSGGNLADIMKLKALMCYQLRQDLAEADIINHLQLDSTTLIRDYTLFYQMTFGSLNTSNCQFLINVYSDDLSEIDHDKPPSQPTFSINNKIVYVTGNHNFLRLLMESYRRFMTGVSSRDVFTAELVFYKYVFLDALQQAKFLLSDNSINFKKKNAFLITKCVLARRLQSWRLRKGDLKCAALTLDAFGSDVDCDTAPIIKLDYAAFINLLLKHTVPLHHNIETHRELLCLYADIDIEHNAIGVFIQSAIRENDDYRSLLDNIFTRLWAIGSGIHRPTSHQLARDMSDLLHGALNRKRNYLATITPKKAQKTSLKMSGSMLLSLGSHHVGGVVSESSPDSVSITETISLDDVDADVMLPSAGGCAHTTSEEIRQPPSIRTCNPAKVDSTLYHSSSRLLKGATREVYAPNSTAQDETQVLPSDLGLKRGSRKLASKMLGIGSTGLREFDLEESIKDSPIPKGEPDQISLDAVVGAVAIEPTKAPSFVNPTSVLGTMHGAQQHQKQHQKQHKRGAAEDTIKHSVLGKK